MPNKEIYDFPRGEQDQLERLEKMRNEGERWRNNWGQRWDRNVSIVRGELWPDRSSKPLFLANLISPTVRRKAGLLVEAKPGIDIRPRRSGLNTTADVLKRTITALLDENNFSMALETLAYYLAAFGCGFLKFTYDPFADYGDGAVVITDVDPRLVLVDPIVRRAANLDECQYFCEESVVPYSWIQQRFPKRAHLVSAETQISYENNETHKISWFQRMIDRVRQRQGAFTDEESGYPRCYVREWWVKDFSHDGDGNLLYPGGRRIFVTGDGTILNPSSNPEDLRYGQANPYWDGLLPYVMLDNQPDLDHPFGQAEVEALRKINEAFNNIGNTTTRTLLKNVPWIIADQGAIDAVTLQDIKELEEVVVEKAPGRSVERTPPVQPSATNVSFMQMMITLIEMFAGLNDGALQGKGRVELRSAPQLEGLQQAAQVLIRAQARRLENTIERGGQLLISRVFQYFTTDKVLTYIDNNQVKDYEFQKEQLRNEIVALAKKEAEQEASDLLNNGEITLNGLADASELKPERIEKHVRGAWRLFRFKVLPFSTLASTKIQRAQMLEQMAQQFMIPKHMIVQEAGFDNWRELRAEALADFQEEQAMGIPQPVPASKGKGGKK